MGLVEKLYNYLYGNIEEFKEEGLEDMLAEKLLVKYEDQLEDLLEETEIKVRTAQNKILIAAKNLLAKGMSAEDIAEAMELTLDTVESLR